MALHDDFTTAWAAETLMLSVVEFRDLTPMTMPIRAESSRIDAKAVKKSFFLLLDKLMFLPECKIPAKKSLIWVISF